MKLNVHLYLTNINTEYLGMIKTDCLAIREQPNPGLSQYDPPLSWSVNSIPA